MASLIFSSSLARVRSAVPLQRAIVVAQRDFKLSVGSIKKGQIVQFKDKAWKVLNRDHSSSGRGGAVIKVHTDNWCCTIKNLLNKFCVKIYA
ncbi:hypothetical protein J3Q64DRAFT_1257635 [Phycomyces blakesleeanus]|uniref:Translation elongation factor KOW-like domain-containing protein n=1 Tax=Phycomyces blakesleeanus TaxID=4837 RepID=A0ABR3ARG5_PHYBL